MGPIGCTETLVRNYYYPLRNNPEQRSFNLCYSISRISSIISYAYFILRLIKKDFDGGTNWLPQNIGKYQSTLRNITDE